MKNSPLSRIAEDQVDAKGSAFTPPALTTVPSRVHVILEENVAVVVNQAAARELDRSDGRIDGTYLGRPIVVAPNVAVKTVNSGAHADESAPTPVGELYAKAQMRLLTPGKPVCDGAGKSECCDETCKLECGKQHKGESLHGAPVCPTASPAPKPTRLLELVGHTPSVSVIDPQFGAYYVPLTSCEETAGLAAAIRGKKDTSVCLLYQAKQCRSQNRCTQVCVRFVSDLYQICVKKVTFSS